MEPSNYHPPRPAKGPLSDIWDKPVRDIVVLPGPTLAPGEIERHVIYSLMLMGLIVQFWNGNKRGAFGNYPWRDLQKRPGGSGYLGGDYLGHNIACIAVDGKGEVIDFDFNHNELLNSSVEHAESRLVRRVFSLTQIYDNWATRPLGDPVMPRKSYSTILSDVTIYTSLESCAQCSGIMALGAVKQVVFLHRDPGQNSIGNILRHLGSVSPAPLPIPADQLGLGAFTALASGYEQFEKEIAGRPFYVGDDGKPDISPSITSYLCTDHALGVFRDGFRQLTEFSKFEDSTYVPKGKDGKPVPGALTNAEVLEHVKRFLNYAVGCGRRGTPHKL